MWDHMCVKSIFTPSKLIKEMYVPYTVYYHNSYCIESRYTIYNLFYKNIITKQLFIIMESY
jgi:hypothetical protein